MPSFPHPPSREVGVVAAVACSVAVGYGVVAPVIPEFARSFGVGRTAAGAVVSAFALMRLVSMLGTGQLVDRYGERRMLALGIGIVAVSSVVAGFAQSYAQLLVLRGIGGVGSAMFSVSAMSLVLRSTPPSRRGRATGFFSGAFLVGGIAGPAVGSTVAHLGMRAPFFLYAGTLAVAGSIGLMALPRLPRRAPGDPAVAGAGAAGTGSDGDGAAGSDRGGVTGTGVAGTGVAGTGGAGTGGAGAAGTELARAARHPAYRAALAAHFADTWAVLGLRNSLVPLFVTEALGLPKKWVYWGFLVVAGVNAVLLFLAGRYADRRGRRPVLLGGLVVTALALVLLAGAGSLPAYVGAMVVLGIGSGMLDVAPGAVVGDVVEGRSGRPIAVYQMAGDAGAVIGPLAAGGLADWTSYGPAFLLSASVLGVAAVLALLAPETRRDAPTEVTPEPVA